MLKKLLLTALFCFAINHTFSQVATDTLQLYQTLKSNDSLLFNVGFNNCDISQFEKLISEDFEFYHDEAGITQSKTAFISGIQNGLCKLNYKPRRELVNGSLHVYPLKKKGVLYGAIQTGEHQFYAVEKDKSEKQTSTAKFTHVWLLENGEWKLSRGLSYDHK
jgi:hypothetical protein